VSHAARRAGRKGERNALVLGGTALAAALLVAACTPNDDRVMGDAAFDTSPRPCRIPEGLTSQKLDAGVDGGPACGDVPASILRETCVGGICHHAGKIQAAHLNLLSPCVADRLVGVVSSCNGRLLVDPAAPERSFILEKLEKAAPECGGQSMPYANHLPANELECVRRWVYAIARAPR
jgi:hypothetical protein